jgi:hypothetical protein
MRVHTILINFGSARLQYKKIFNPKYNIANPANPKIPPILIQTFCGFIPENTSFMPCCFRFKGKRLFCLFFDRPRSVIFAKIL